MSHRKKDLNYDFESLDSDYEEEEEFEDEEYYPKKKKKIK